jgi:hypothetical protein
MKYAILIIIIVFSICFCSSDPKTRKSYLEQDVVRKNATIDSLKNQIQNSLDNSKTLKFLTKSILQRDQFNYMVVALSGLQHNRNNEAWAMPIMLVVDSLLVRPDDSKYLDVMKAYFSDPNRYFSVDFSGNVIGAIKVNSEYNWDGVRFKIAYLDSNLIDKLKRKQQDFNVIASTLFPYSRNISKRTFGNDNQKQEARKVAIRVFKSDGVSIRENDPLDLFTLEILQPNGSNSHYAFSIFRFYERKEKRIEHYLSLCYSLTDTNLSPIYKEHTFSDENDVFGANTYSFLDLIDYNFDGSDEFLIIESGYEHRDIILYQLKENELIEIYRIPTSPT